MKLKILIYLLFIAFQVPILFAHSGDTIRVKDGTSPTIDGILSPGEWSDASFIEIASIGGRVYFKHDAKYLYAAFIDDIGYSNSCGIYIDKFNKGGVKPDSDCIWLHGSATQWEWIGSDTSWRSIAPKDWGYCTKTVNEFKIALSKFDSNKTNNKTMGVLFSFMDWSSGYEITWPSGGLTNCKKPDTWADMIIEMTTAVENNQSNNVNSFIIYPNPSNDYIFISGFSGDVEIYNLLGIRIWNNNIINNSRIDISNFEKGIYLLKVGNRYSKFIKI